MKKPFTLHTLRLKGTKLSYESRAFEADHYLPEDQSHLPIEERRVDYPEYYRADEFAQAIHGGVPSGMFADDARTVLAIDLTKTLKKVYASVEEEGAVAYKIRIGKDHDEDPRMYAWLRMELERTLYAYKEDIQAQMRALQLKDEHVNKLMDRAVKARRPKMNGGDQ